MTIYATFLLNVPGTVDAGTLTETLTQGPEGAPTATFGPVTPTLAVGTPDSNGNPTTDTSFNLTVSLAASGFVAGQDATLFTSAYTAGGVPMPSVSQTGTITDLMLPGGGTTPVPDPGSTLDLDAVFEGPYIDLSEKANTLSLSGTEFLHVKAQAASAVDGSTYDVTLCTAFLLLADPASVGPLSAAPWTPAEWITALSPDGVSETYARILATPTEAGDSFVWIKLVTAGNTGLAGETIVRPIGSLTITK